MEMTPNDVAAWNHLHQTPVLFNHHEPLELNATSIAHVDLNKIDSTKNALEKKWVDSTREKLGSANDQQILQKTFDRMK